MSSQSMMTSVKDLNPLFNLSSRCLSSYVPLFGIILTLSLFYIPLEIQTSLNV